MNKIIKFLKSKTFYIASALLIQLIALFLLVTYFSQRFVGIYYILVLLSWIVSLRVINRESDTSSKMLWILLIMSLPFFGGLVYLLFGERKIPKALMIQDRQAYSDYKIYATRNIELMNDVKNAGFKVGMGYRNFTNASKNWISACSSTLFAYMNQFTSNGRSVLFKKMTLTGTGYFIDFDIIDNEGGWIFNGMTEDVELTKYCYYHNISMKYYPLAQYYDEQPTTIKTVHKQHIRWVWGFFANDKKYKKKNSPNYHALDKTKQNISLFEFNVSIYPLVLMGALLGLAFLISFGFFIASLVFAAFLEPFRTNLVPLSMFIWMLIYFIILWISVGLVAFVTFVISNRYLKFSILLQIKVMFTYLFFFIDFVLAFLDGLFHKYKRVSWDKIDHYGVITNKEALENLKNESKARK